MQKQINHTEAARQIEEITKRLLEKIDDDENRVSNVERTLKDLRIIPLPTVQLYGVSQAGKSTLFSFFTNGEQYAPVGDGTKTTIITSKLIYSEQNERAEFTVKSHADILSTFLESLLAFIPWDKFPRKRENSLNHFFSRITRKIEKGDDLSLQQALKIINLDFPSHRNLIKEGLENAESLYAKLKNNNTEFKVSQDDLVVGNILIRYYAEYEKLRKRGSFSKSLRDATPLIRRPKGLKLSNWKNYSFNDLRPFFLKEVNIFSRCHSCVREIHIMDGPGFGVSSFDNKTCMEGLIKTDAVLLVLGSNESELNSGQKIDLGKIVDLVSDKEVFVAWNARKIRKGQAINILVEDLKTLKEMGLRVSKENSCVIDARLGLRSTQLLNFDKLSNNTIDDLAIEYAKVEFTERS